MGDGEHALTRPEQAALFERELLDLPLPEEELALVAEAVPAVSEAAVRAYFEAVRSTDLAASGRSAEDALRDYFR